MQLLCPSDTMKTDMVSIGKDRMAGNADTQVHEAEQRHGHRRTWRRREVKETF